VKGVKLASDEDKRNLVTFKGLEDEEIIELGTDEAVRHAKELFRQTLQESGTIWVVIQFLQKDQAQDRWFHYDIAKDENGSPIGVVWTTQVM
jgi:hypothetical protein